MQFPLLILGLVGLGSEGLVDQQYLEGWRFLITELDVTEEKEQLGTGLLPLPRTSFL